MLNWGDASPAVYYNIVILPQILVSYILPPLVIYINMHRLWIMHKPYFKCRAFNSHSAVVYTPIWLALPCFHYSQFLGTQKRLKRLTGMDSIFSCVWGKYLFPFQGNWCCKVLPVIIAPSYFFPRKNAFNGESEWNNNVGTAPGSVPWTWQLLEAACWRSNPELFCVKVGPTAPAGASLSLSIQPTWKREMWSKMLSPNVALFTA